MAKNAVTDWDETAANNLDVGGVSIAEGMNPSGVNDAMREMMAQIAKLEGADSIASATITDLGSVPGRYVSITGTTTITGFGTVTGGTLKFVTWSNVLTLTHSAALLLPGAGNIVTAANDTAIFVSRGSGNWRCISYQRANGELALGTVVNATGQTTMPFANIPPGTRQITVNFSQLSTNGTSGVVIQIGDSSGYQTSGYTGAGGVIITSSASIISSTSGFQLPGAAASNARSGSVVLSLQNSASNLWCASGVIADPGQSTVAFIGGAKALTAELDRVRIAISGADTFDAGSVNILYH